MEAWVGVAGVALGVVLTSVFEWIRNERAIRIARSTRIDDRSTELWQISLPASASLQKRLASVLRFSKPDLRPVEDPVVPFDEGFPEWWEDRELAVQSDIGLIPNGDVRSALSTVAEGITYGWGIARYAGFESSGRASVNKVAQVGFDIVSAWMRGEQELESTLADRVEEISAALIEMHDSYENME